MGHRPKAALGGDRFGDKNGEAVRGDGEGGGIINILTIMAMSAIMAIFIV
jgi:hypothetical protein